MIMTAKDVFDQNQKNVMQDFSEFSEYITAFRQDAEELLSDIQECVLDIEQEHNNKDAIDRLFRAIHTIKGSGSMFGFKKVSEFSHHVETVLDEVRKDNLSVTPELINLILASRDQIKKMINSSEVNQNIDNELIETIVEALYSLMSNKKQHEIIENEEKIIPKLGEILLEQGDVSFDALDDALNYQKQLSEKTNVAAISDNEQLKQLSITNVKVSSDKLDRLVNFVGELVIIQARLSQLAANADNSDIISCSENIERLINNLRDCVLNIRMFPISTIFTKFRRLIRDLSAQLGKDLEFTTEGGNTELDKTVLDRIDDPLVHLIRNSIDHGIEMPEERKKKGKNPKGVIDITAAHKGTNILISIKDDGAGLNAEIIHKKAIERGLISKDVKLSKQDIYNFIFAPGFSTAAKVTDVSGRGVGMDVVKRYITSLGGSIGIESEKDKGTNITLKLPLTLAIIDGFLIKIASEFFIIPLSSIEECIEIKHDIIHRNKANRVINLRGELVPYVCLREIFSINGLIPEIEQIVIASVGNDRVGFLVDNVIGQYQTVIKPLGRIYQNIEGISGATILGDGTVSLILDLSKIIEISKKVKNII